MLEKERRKGKAGITLISLVITIIVLLILSTAAIMLAVDSNGLFSRAGTAANKWNTSVGNEENKMNELLGILEQQVPDYQPMVTKWNVASGDTIEIYVYSPYNYTYDENGEYQEIPLENTTDFEINWGDGTVEHYTKDNLNYDEYDCGYITHTYGEENVSLMRLSSSTYEVTITITGSCNMIGISYNENLTSIEDWGYTGSAMYGFNGCTNLSSIASPSVNTFKNVTIFDDTFSGCSSLSSIPEDLFASCPNVTSFASTFAECTNLTGETIIPIWENYPETLTEENGYVGIPDGRGCYDNCNFTLEEESQIPEYWRQSSK